MKEAAIATTIRQSEEGRAIEPKVPNRIQELEAKMKEINRPTETTVVRTII